MVFKKDSIPFNKPFIIGEELQNIDIAVNDHGHIAGNGPFTRRCQNWLENRIKCRKVLLTHSCTAALEMSAILCDIKPGDEIIMPSFTFASTANAFVLRGGVPVFVDVRKDSLNIDEKIISQAITHRTKVIVPVHYAGISCAMSEILTIADQYGLMVVEDAAQAMLSQYNGKFLGSIGHLGCLSFHETKNVISGEGGALLINDDSLIERAEIIWENGTNRNQFFRGITDKYTWVDIGSSFLPSELMAAFLYAQLEHAEKIIEARSRIFNRYYTSLTPLEIKGFIRLPSKGTGSTYNGHIFYIITRSLKERNRLITFLEKNNINAVFHYTPLHSSLAGKKYGRTAGDMTVTINMSDRLLRLPMYFPMSNEEVDRVVEVLYKFFLFYDRTFYHTNLEQPDREKFPAFDIS